MASPGRCTKPARPLPRRRSCHAAVAILPPKSRACQQAQNGQVAGRAIKPEQAPLRLPMLLLLFDDASVALSGSCHDLTNTVDETAVATSSQSHFEISRRKPAKLSTLRSRSLLLHRMNSMVWPSQSEKSPTYVLVWLITPGEDQRAARMMPPRSSGWQKFSRHGHARFSPGEEIEHPTEMTQRGAALIRQLREGCRALKRRNEDVMGVRFLVLR